jgi:hypothetical protein
VRGSLASEGRTSERWRNLRPGIGLRLEEPFKAESERNPAVTVIEKEYLFFSPRMEDRGDDCEENMFTENVAIGGWNSVLLGGISGPVQVDVRLGGTASRRRRFKISSAVSLTSSATLLCFGPPEEICKEIVARSAGTVRIEEPLSCRESL